MLVAMRYNYGRPHEGPSYEFMHFHQAWEAYCVERGWAYQPFWFEQAQDGELESGDKAARLLHAVEKFRPGLLFWVIVDERMTVPASVIDDLRRSKKTSDKMRIVTWGCDDSWRWQNPRAPIGGYVVRADVHITTDPEMCHKGPAGGQPFVILSQWAAEPSFFRRPLSKELFLGGHELYDVSFCGMRHSNREGIASALQWRYGKKFRLAGTGWSNKSYVAYDDYRNICWRSKICLNLSNASGGGQQTKGRHFELPAMGAFQITTPVDHLGEFFEPGKEIVIVENEPTALLGAIDYYLAHSDERRAIAAAGHLRASTEHLWKHRFDKILVQLGKMWGYIG